MITGALRPAVELPPPDRTGEEIRQATQRVLSEERFAEVTPDLLARLLDAAGDLLARVLAVVASSPVGRVGAGLVAVVVVGGLAAAAVWLGLRMRSRTAPRPSPPVGVEGRTAVDWDDAAAAAERRGDLREAVRCRHRALVAALVDAGLVEEVPGRTAGAYLAAVRRDVPAAAGPFAVATQAFEDAWYGHRTVTAADLERTRAAAAQVRGQVGHVGRAGRSERAGPVVRGGRG